MKFNGRATDALLERPTCDVCGLVPAIADCATLNGSWGYLCELCFAKHGIGLGVGVGQYLLCGDDFDAKLINELERGQG